MAAVQRNEELNQALVNILRSLLQYVSESWPWTGEGAADVHAKVEQLVRRQRSHVERLRDLLYDRYWPIDFGVYPAEYTDLHYLALDYLLAQMDENQGSLAQSLERTLAECADDAAGAATMRDIVREEQEIARALRDLAKSRPATGSTLQGGAGAR